MAEGIGESSATATSMPKPLRILFILRHPGSVRNFESTLSLLAQRGHHVHLAFDKTAKMEGSLALIRRLCEQHPSISYSLTPGRDIDGWSVLATKLRLSIDYLRYLTPRYRDAVALRERAEQRAPRVLRRLMTWPTARTERSLSFVTRGLHLLEEAIPSNKLIDDFIRQRQPDAVLVSPLVELGSSQADYIRSAKVLGIRTGLCVYSWDNLTNKGLIRDIPDLVTVWNEAQKQEAVELHGVPASRVVVTGAAAYDHWFEWAPRTSRDEFCRRVGLRADHPFFLYLCSSPFIAPDETTFVAKWIGQLRSLGRGHLDEVGILIRPHPQNAAQWREVDLSYLDQVTVWPLGGADPIDGESRADFYDSMYHCAAVIGVNTSALIESAIVDRPVYTMLAPEFRGTQEGTLHFHHLTRVNGGLLNVATSFEEHVQQLIAALAPNARRDEQNSRFLEAFVRPYGLSTPATPKLVAAIEAICQGALPTPRPCPPRIRAGRLILAPLAWYARLRKIRTKGRKRLKRLREKERIARRPTPIPAPAWKRVARATLRSVGRVGPLRWIVTRYTVPALKRTVRLLTTEVIEVTENGQPANGQPMVLLQASSRPEAPAASLVQPKGNLPPGGDLWMARAADSGAIVGLLSKPARERITSAKTPVSGLSEFARHDSIAVVIDAIRLLAQQDDAPIIAGPWVSEVGFELLYWVPFLNWVVTAQPDLAARLAVVSRGGTAHWYQAASSRYIDVFDFLSPEEFRRRRGESAAETGGKQKQLFLSSFEWDIIERVKSDLALPKAHVLHPSLMYQSVRWLVRRQSLPRFGDISSARMFDLPEVGGMAELLPDDYVAVRFYFNESFPDTPENRAFIGSTLRTLAEQTKIVLLNPGIVFDDHFDFDGIASEQLVRIDQFMTPTNNLGIQTAVISRARAFVGTYGGLAYLSPFFKVPSLCFYSHRDRFLHYHLERAYRLFREPGWGEFVALDTKHLELMRFVTRLRTDGAGIVG